MAIERLRHPGDTNTRYFGASVKFDALTSLRGIAALCTVFAHLISIWGGVAPVLDSSVLFRSFALHTYLFVDFFFLLSGFVMVHAYGGNFANAVDGRDYARFMRARFARVYPLHAVLLLVYVCLAIVGFKQTQENPDWSITANLLLVHAMGFFDHTTWNQPSWSISVEWCTYIVFPFAAVAARKLIRPAAVVYVLLSIIALFCGMAFYFGSANLTVGFAFLRCLIGFSAGACLYVVARNHPSPIHPGRLTMAMLFSAVLVLTFVPSPYSDTLAFACFCAIVYAASQVADKRQLLCHPRLIWIGDISYSIYLWHSLLLHVFAKALGVIKAHGLIPQQQQTMVFLAALVLFEACLLLLAHLSYRYIEVPCRTWLGPKRRTAPQSALAAPVGETPAIALR